MIERSMVGAVAVLTLEHGKANALDLEFCQELTRVFEAEEESDSRAVVLTSEGGIFSAGVDLKRLTTGESDYVEQFMPALCRAFETISLFPKPMVVACNGHAIAGGCVILCAGDHRFMAEGRGRVGVPELVVGVPFPMGAFEIMRQVIARPLFQQVIYGGQTYSGEDIVRFGFADEIVDSASLLARATEKAETLAKIPAATFRVSKMQMREAIAAANGSSLDQRAQSSWNLAEIRDAVTDYVNRTLG